MAADPTSLPSNLDYLVKVEIPNDVLLGRPMYKVTREEDINIANGDSFVPQVPPPACAGALHTVDVAGSGTDNYGRSDMADRQVSGCHRLSRLHADRQPHLC